MTIKYNSIKTKQANNDKQGDTMEETDADRSINPCLHAEN